VRTELKNLITLRDALTAAENKIKDQVTTIKGLEDQKSRLDEEWDPESQEYLDEVARLDEEIAAVAIDATTGEKIKDWDKNKAAYDAAKTAL